MAIEVGHSSNILTNTGRILGGTAFLLDATADTTNLSNSGDISATTGDAINISSTQNFIQNDGTIRSSAGAAIHIIGDALPANTETIVNNGTLESTGLSGILSVLGNAQASLVVNNTGIISGGSFSINASGLSNDHIVNSGTLIGTLTLGGGDDSYFGHGGLLNSDAVLGDGNDTIDLRGGAINGTVYGGNGNDSYYLDDAATKIVEGTDPGIDQVFAATSYHLGDNIENLTLLEAGNYSGTGNALANTMTGNSGDNRLIGLDGNDTLTGAMGSDRLAGGSGNDNLGGGDGDDSLQGNLGNDTLAGGEGDDTIVGGYGRDSLTGNGGADVFVFTALGQSGVTVSTYDTITDFTQGDDVINLAAIDAKTTNAAPNDAFTFIGAAPFSGVAGQLHYLQSAGSTFIEMDVNGDGVADSIIRLAGLITLNASDFVL